jgi:protein disulfide-isomerase A1
MPFIVLHQALYESIVMGNLLNTPVLARLTALSPTCTSGCCFVMSFVIIDLRLSWYRRQSLPAVTEVTVENHDEFRKADKIVAVLYVPTSTDVPAPEFSATAEKHRDSYLFGLSTDKDAFNLAGVDPPALVLYRQFDEPRVLYPYPVASASVEDVEQWIADLSIPYLDEVGAENYALYADSGKPLAYVFVDPSDEHTKDHLDALKLVATKYHRYVNFVWIDATKFGDHAKALNLMEEKWPAFVIQDLDKQLKFPYDQSNPLVPEKVDEMVEAFRAGKLEPQLRSQPVPEVQDEPVFNLVGKQFEEIVFDDDRDVFVEFYATWSVRSFYMT